MTGRGSARRDVAEVSGRVGSSGRRRDGTRVSEPRTRRAFGRAWWWPRRADARARMKRSGRGTHPELLERVRLARTLPEERREIHAVALSLQVGDNPRGFLHVLGGCGIEGRGGEGERRRQRSVAPGSLGMFSRSFRVDATYPNRPPRPARFRIRTRHRHPVSGVKRTSRARSPGASIRAERLAAHYAGRSSGPVRFSHQCAPATQAEIACKRQRTFSHMNIATKVQMNNQSKETTGAKTRRFAKEKC